MLECGRCRQETCGPEPESSGQVRTGFGSRWWVESADVPVVVIPEQQDDQHLWMTFDRSQACQPAAVASSTATQITRGNVTTFTMDNFIGLDLIECFEVLSKVSKS